MEQPVQILGAILILAAYIAAQRDVWSPHSAIYLWFNFAGALILATLATLDADWGFLLLEGVWAAVSGWSLVALARTRGRLPAG